VWDGGIGWREVKVGSSRCRGGVESALRFWLMVSSIVEREARRKSVPVSRGRGGEDREGEPFSARVEKQNCGLSGGWSNFDRGESAMVVECPLQLTQMQMRLPSPASKCKDALHSDRRPGCDLQTSHSRSCLEPSRQI